jgi:hypothetical protein
VAVEGGCGSQGGGKPAVRRGHHLGHELSAGGAEGAADAGGEGGYW